MQKAESCFAKLCPQGLCRWKVVPGHLCQQNPKHNVQEAAGGSGSGWTDGQIFVREGLELVVCCGAASTAQSRAGREQRVREPGVGEW